MIRGAPGGDAVPPGTGSHEEWLGLEFGEALAKARPFRVLLTRPPYRCLGKGRLLVVGQRQESEGLTLLLTYTEFERLPKEAANT
jgi:hypothetical protein